MAFVMGGGRDDPQEGGKPTEEEVGAILGALDGASDTAKRVIEALDRTHELMQDNIREVREAQEVAHWSNEFAVIRMTSTK